MIPAAFDYHRPKDIAGVIALLETHGDAARVVAGGHSLIPMMKLRMAEVGHLIDLQDVAGLKCIAIERGQITLGAMVTQAEIIGHAGLASAAPILRETALQIADPQVRALGTIGGNLANGDPGNDMPALMQCLDARFVLEGPDGRREVPARGFYETAYVTGRAEDEVLTAVTFAAPPAGHAYDKQKRKIGDYATAAAAVVMRREAGLCAGASVALTNLADVPIWSEAAGAALDGTPVDKAAIAAAVAAAMADIDPAEDNRGPVAFKRQVAARVLAGAIAKAWARA